MRALYLGTLISTGRRLDRADLVHVIPHSSKVSLVAPLLRTLIKSLSASSFVPSSQSISLSVRPEVSKSDILSRLLSPWSTGFSWRKFKGRKTCASPLSVQDKKHALVSKAFLQSLPILLFRFSGFPTEFYDVVSSFPLLCWVLASLRLAFIQDGRPAWLSCGQASMYRPFDPTHPLRLKLLSTIRGSKKEPRAPQTSFLKERSKSLARACTTLFSFNVDACLTSSHRRHVHGVRHLIFGFSLLEFSECAYHFLFENQITTRSTEYETCKELAQLVRFSSWFSS